MSPSVTTQAKVEELRQDTEIQKALDQTSAPGESGQSSAQTPTQILPYDLSAGPVSFSALLITSFISASFT